MITSIKEIDNELSLNFVSPFKSLLYLWDFFIFIFAYECFLHVCMCAMCIPDAWKSQKSASKKYWDTSSCEFPCVLFGTESWTSAKAATVCHNWAISSAYLVGSGPLFIIFYRRSISHWNLSYGIRLYSSTKHLDTTVKSFAYTTPVVPVSSQHYSIVDEQANKRDFLYENRVGYLRKPI